MSWAQYGGIYWISGGTQKFHAAKPSACAWNWSLTRNWDYIKIKSTFFSISHGDKYSFSLLSYSAEKNLKLEYRWESPSLHYIYSATTSMSYPLWTQLAVSEQGCTSKNTLLLPRFLLPSQLEHAASSPYQLGLVKDTRNDNVGKAALAGHSVGTGSTQWRQALASQNTCGDGSSQPSVS